MHVKTMNILASGAGHLIWHKISGPTSEHWGSILAPGIESLPSTDRPALTFWLLPLRQASLDHCSHLRRVTADNSAFSISFCSQISKAYFLPVFCFMSLFYLSINYVKYISLRFWDYCKKFAKNVIKVYFAESVKIYIFKSIYFDRDTEGELWGQRCFTVRSVPDGCKRQGWRNLPGGWQRPKHLGHLPMLPQVYGQWAGS